MPPAAGGPRRKCGAGSRRAFRLLITGPQAFERTLVLAFDDDPAVIAERLREILEEWIGRSDSTAACCEAGQ